MIVLLSDFGMADGYVAAMKGVIARVAPNEVLLDATHDIPPQDIAGGAWALSNYVSFYPPGTIHIAVVDPGVGTGRSLVLVEADGQRIFAPDNGLLSIWLGGVSTHRVWGIRKNWHRPGGESATFHGRDILAYAAGLLATNTLPDDVLIELDYPLMRLPESVVQVEKDHIIGQVMHIDRFGNAITGVTNHHLNTFRAKPKAVILPFGEKIPFKRTYADVVVGKSLALINSSEHVELAVHAGNASLTHGLIRGSQVKVMF